MKTRPIDTSCHELVGNGVIPSGLGPPFPVGGCRGWKKLGLELRAHWIDTANAEGPILGPESLVSPPKTEIMLWLCCRQRFLFLSRSGPSWLARPGCDTLGTPAGLSIIISWNVDFDEKLTPCWRASGLRGQRVGWTWNGAQVFL